MPIINIYIFFITLIDSYNNVTTNIYSVVKQFIDYFVKIFKNSKLTIFRSVDFSQKIWKKMKNYHFFYNELYFFPFWSKIIHHLIVFWNECCVSTLLTFAVKLQWNYSLTTAIRFWLQSSTVSYIPLQWTAGNYCNY